MALRFIDAEFPSARLDEKLIDIYAVATFFFSTGGISWTNNTKWKLGDPVCVWHGIECDANGYVIAIELPRNNLIGTLPQELGLLSPRFIQPSSSSSSSSLSSSSSSSLNNDDYNNNMNDTSTTTSTSTSTTGLRRLDLSGNRIKGMIPEQVTLLSSMKEFMLQGNPYFGRLPEGIRYWTALQRLSITDTNLEGEVPTELCSIPNATTLLMSVDCLNVACQCCYPSCGAEGLESTKGQPTPAATTATTTTTISSRDR